MNILNLYAGIGGNRKYWQGHDVVAVEYNPAIAKVYKQQYPDDKVIIGDAHKVLLEEYQNFDFIWSSPPCQSHSRMIRSGKNRSPRYPDLKLYEEILHLQHNFKGFWVVENVVPYYKPLVEPNNKVGRHLFWGNFEFKADDVKSPKGFINKTTVAGAEQLKDWLGIHYEGNLYYEGNHCPAQVLRNAVHPLIGRQVLEAAERLKNDKS